MLILDAKGHHSDRHRRAERRSSPAWSSACRLDSKDPQSVTQCLILFCYLYFLYFYFWFFLSLMGGVLRIWALSAADLPSSWPLGSRSRSDLEVWGGLKWATRVLLHQMCFQKVIANLCRSLQMYFWHHQILGYDFDSHIESQFVTCLPAWCNTPSMICFVKPMRRTFWLGIMCFSCSVGCRLQRSLHVRVPWNWRMGDFGGVPFDQPAMEPKTRLPGCLV